MRVVLFSQYFPPEVGATQTRAEYFARKLAEKDHDVTVIAEVPNHPLGIVFEGWRGRLVRRTSEHGYEVIRIWVYTSPHKSFWGRIAFYLTYCIGAALTGVFLLRRRPDVVLATSPPLPVLISGWTTALVHRCPFVADIRDIWPAVGIALGELQGRRSVALAKMLERFLYRRAAAVTCVTRGFVDHVVATGVDPRKVHLLPNGTLPEVFDPSHREAGLRSRLGLDEEAFVVGYVGLHGIAQGLTALLDAAAFLEAERGVRFLLVGEGPVKSNLMADMARRRLTNVVFHSQVPMEHVASFINACDVMIVPLRRLELLSTFVPSKVFDFMCCAKPIIIMVDGEARALVDEAGAGIFVPAEDGERLAVAIRELRAAPEERARMGHAGRAYVLAHFVRERQAAQLDALINALPRVPGPRGDGEAFAGR